MTILNDIMQYKRTEELPRQMATRELASVQAEATLAAKPRDFVAALCATDRIALIAEVRNGSPGKLLSHNFNPLELAAIYADNGADAIAVLTDTKYFQGKLEHLTQIRSHLDPTAYLMPSAPSFVPPLLCKDFIFHPYQVYQARAAGADALLLIADALNDKEMDDLLTLTRKLDMAAVIEVHNRVELERALPLQPRLISVNNRSSDDFSIDLNTCIELRRHIPANICVIAEGGIHTPADVACLSRAGLNAVLVGEALFEAKSVGKKIRELLSYEM